MKGDYTALAPEAKMKALLCIAESQARQARMALERHAIDCENAYAALDLAGLIQTTKLDSGLHWDAFHTRLNIPMALSSLKGLAFRTKPCNERMFLIARDACYRFRKLNTLPAISIRDYRSIK